MLERETETVETDRDVYWTVRRERLYRGLERQTDRDVYWTVRRGRLYRGLERL